MHKDSLFIKTLQENNFSITKTRRFVFNLLASNNEPQSMHQLIETSRREIDRVSVYRTIEIFEKIGIVQRINIGWKYKIELSDMFLDHHHHMTCIDCGRMVAIKHHQEFENIIEKLGKANGFTLKQHQLEMQGYCHECQTHSI